MDEPEQHEPEQPVDGAPAGAAIPQPPPPVRAHRLRGALASRAAGWVVAVALAGAVVALSAVLATAPRGLQVRALPGLTGPASIVAIPAPGVRGPAAVTGPDQVQIHAVLPSLVPGVMCVRLSGPRSFQVVRPAGPGKPLSRAFVVLPGAVTLVPAVVCPAG
jgi:hypothetical protein